MAESQIEVSTGRSPALVEQDKEPIWYESPVFNQVQDEPSGGKPKVSITSRNLALADNL